MDRPGALAVKLNTRDRKGSGAHPGYSPKLSPAMDRSPAPWGHTDLSSPGAGQGLHSPGPSPKDQSHPSPSLGMSPAGGTQAEEGTGTGTASSFPFIWGRSEGTPGVSVGQSCPESPQPVPGELAEGSSSSRQWLVQEELQQSFLWCGHPRADGGESFWSFSVQDSCDTLISMSRPLQCCPRRRRRGGRGTRRGR